MNLNINTNVTAINAHRNLNSNGINQKRATSRLSSGLRINNAADDSAGLSISEGMRNQIRGMNQATRNTHDGISLVQTAEGALEEVHRIFERVRVLTIQAANDTTTNVERAMIGTELINLTDEVWRIGRDTQFNGLYLFKGSNDAGNFYDKEFQIQIGANSNQSMNIKIYPMMHASGWAGLDRLLYYSPDGSGRIDEASGEPQIYGWGFSRRVNDSFRDTTIYIPDDWAETTIISSESLSNSLMFVDFMINEISGIRSNLGAYQNRLEHAINSNMVAEENLSAANSRIRDADMAQESMNLTQSNVLSQAAMSMLAQANVNTQGVLQLLQ